MQLETLTLGWVYLLHLGMKDESTLILSRFKQEVEKGVKSEALKDILKRA